MSMIWCDPRMKFKPKLGRYVLYNDSLGHNMSYKMWTPEMRIINGSKPRVQENIKIYNFYDGTVMMSEIFSNEVLYTFELDKEPFDTQNLTIEVGSLS
mmetsp:Transcript_76945/g.166452  ORF Transcript_76945/g.166452 Transcript_76945/m.166452 type:complete len:98 (+) Transcript_76945:467-760(+)